MIKGQVMTQATNDDYVSKSTELPTHMGMSFKLYIIVDKRQFEYACHCYKGGQFPYEKG